MKRYKLKKIKDKNQYMIIDRYRIKTTLLNSYPYTLDTKEKVLGFLFGTHGKNITCD